MRGFVAPLLKGLVFVVVTGLATAVLALSIGNTGVGGTAGYSARFTDVTSLTVGDDVRISGVRVGQVDGMEIVDRHLALVRFSVDRAHRLPASVRATIKYRNMVGQRYIALDPGDPRATGTLPEGGEIPLDRTAPALDLTELFNGFKPLFQALSPDEVNRLSGEIVQVLQGEGGTVESLLARTGSLTAALADRDRVIGEVIGNLNTVLRTVNSGDDRLATLVSTLRRLVSGLAEDRSAIGEAIGGMAALTTATAGLFELARPPLKDSIAGLDELSTNLAEHEGDVERFLELLPAKFDAVGRLGSYGSWLNFYLCEATLVTDPPRRAPLPPSERCQA
ncbi:phospholipid/cholesterol/gamma-HCH transport system substrate-binding protein [Amycolatopsis arida]|uniref:Phospholipid/cholesterol/gamma-HCH transport system substrate-binding protein n=1 Tax=Amycolatopsis arida TaxID=587909 RepID=A0A1I5K6U1_9PSEU|nr:MCE family protein [Amycolatopsis arida]TDX96911.1 phospholipid/cholesterol/gamma-HCH transport system substrate-binding protein [Amycolatopsis arida]SFO80740.1 phospholipid/cholesterol/gamma-HCH transport system substrate-binding protein [Amycolatopsis arida]